MFENLRNHIYLSFWKSNRKVGPHREILLRRRWEDMENTVFDISWTMTPADRKTNHARPHVISERASKWNLLKVIRRIERDVLPDEIRKYAGNLKK